MTDASFSYSSDERVITATNANSSITTYLDGVRREVDSVRTILTIPGTGAQTYCHRYTYRSNGLLDSVYATGPGGLTFTSRRYGYHGARLDLDTIRLAGAVTRFSRNQDGLATAIRLPPGDSIRFGHVPRARSGGHPVPGAPTTNTTTTTWAASISSCRPTGFSTSPSMGSAA